MRRGDFAAAWEVSDAILRQRVRGGVCCHDWPRHLQFLWDGRPLDGLRVAVHCYHGLGDTLQFARLLPLLRRRVRHLAVVVQPQLLGWLRGIPGVDAVEALSDAAAEVECDAHVELMELPHILRLSVADIPPPLVPRMPLRAPARGTAGGLRVGIAWRSGDWDAARSLPDAALAPLGAVHGVRWMSLQYPACTPPFAADMAGCRDIPLLARRMRDLDLVVSVDTMTAHLAGTLGLPTVTLLPQPCDWRWLERREDTPWYPAMRLLRQSRAGDWTDVVECVVAELRLRADRTRGSANAFVGSGASM
jgi:hypothetical protein